ncbi:hypothetical protein [Levilactobacillus brevis]|uniref:hypothetical protein n=1 Tax=Levilactobacillus brevis TaxID=1580 RepID=UPI001C1F02F5|nr:hypothetical protein [Levilactobacillus brevis]MBU7558892.1 hypothetical protein [Levilactobacillus brevis]MCE6010501.1 hypothetical protein [Levilactobacillus brevis]MCE6025062.1 hypothetical protein [Levilactobacillus brevis]MCE6035837.1 hypothetical protein [Levilactobacillus brevis]
MAVNKDLINQALMEMSKLSEGKAIQYSLKESDISYHDLKETVDSLNSKYPKFAFAYSASPTELLFIVKKLFNQF